MMMSLRIDRQLSHCVLETPRDRQTADLVNQAEVANAKTTNVSFLLSSCVQDEIAKQWIK